MAKNEIIIGEGVSIVGLPSSFTTKWVTNEDGSETLNFYADPDGVNENGEDIYKFNTSINFIDVEDIEPGQTPVGKIAENWDEKDVYYVDKEPAFICIAIPEQIEFFGTVAVTMVVTTCLFNVSDKKVGSINLMFNAPGEDVSGITLQYKRLLQFLKHIIVNGKNLQPDGITPAKLRDRLIYAHDFGSIDATEQFVDGINKAQEEPNQKEAAIENEFKRIGDAVRVSKADSRLFLVNDQWTFRLPYGVSYEVDAKYDDGLGGIDLSGDIKPMVLSGVGGVLNASVGAHCDLSGSYYSVIDCRYDNRYEEGDDNHKIYRDEDDLYVDITEENFWPMGHFINVRVRGEEIDPINIRMSLGYDIDQLDGEQAIKYLVEIGKSIDLPQIKELEPSAKSTASKAPVTVNDPNCIVQGTTLIKYTGSSTNIVLPDGLTEIADNTFAGKINIVSVYVPDGVRRIGSRAFENCFDLERIDLPDSLEEIGSYAFVDCHNLGMIHLSDNISSIGGSAFSECYKLQLDKSELPASLRRIDAFTFKNCRELSKIIVPDSVNLIWALAFANCNNLRDVYIPASVTTLQDNLMGGGVFDGSSSVEIHCPKGSAAEDYAISHNLLYDNNISVVEETDEHEETDVLDEEEYDADKSSTETLVPDDGDSIIPDGTEIIKYYDEYLSNLNGIKNLVIPDSVREIGDYAFEGKEDLVSVTLPSTLKLIGKSAFGGCTNLSNIDLPNTSDIEYGKRVFSDARNLFTVTIPKEMRVIPEEMFRNCSRLFGVLIFNTSKLTRVESKAFSSCYSLTRIDIPETVEYIGDSVFSGCYRLRELILRGENTVLDNITGHYNIDNLTIYCIPGSQTEINAKASGFNTESIESSYNNDKVPMIDHDTAKNRIIVNGKWCISIPRGFTYEEVFEMFLQYDPCKPYFSKKFKLNAPRGSYSIECGAVLAEGEFNTYRECKYSFDLMDRRDGYKYEQVVLRDEDGIFVNLIESVDSCGYVSYVMHVRIKGLTPFDFLSEISSLSNARKSLRDNRKKVFKAIADSISIIGDNTITEDRRYINKNKLTYSDDNTIISGYNVSESGRLNIFVSDDISEIAPKAFFDNNRVHCLVAENNLKRIGESAFENCDDLKLVVIKGEKITVEKKAFSRCASLKKVLIESQLSTIDDSVFRGCRSLEELMIPDGCYAIKKAAFENCSELRYLYVPSSVSCIECNDGKTPFDGCEKLLILGREQSYIKTFCEEHNITFEAFNHEFTDPDKSIADQIEVIRRKAEEERIRLETERYEAALETWRQEVDRIKTARSALVDKEINEEKERLEALAQKSLNEMIAKKMKIIAEESERKNMANEILNGLGLFAIKEKNLQKANIADAILKISKAEAEITKARADFAEERKTIPQKLQSFKIAIERRVEVENPLPAEPVR